MEAGSGDRIPGIGVPSPRRARPERGRALLRHGTHAPRPRRPGLRGRRLRPESRDGRLRPGTPPPRGRPRLGRGDERLRAAGPLRRGDQPGQLDRIPLGRGRDRGAPRADGRRAPHRRDLRRAVLLRRRAPEQARSAWSHHAGDIGTTLLWEVVREDETARRSYQHCRITARRGKERRVFDEDHVLATGPTRT